jgi:hypothetical protein
VNTFHGTDSRWNPSFSSQRRVLRFIPFSSLKVLFNEEVKGSGDDKTFVSLLLMKGRLLLVFCVWKSVFREIFTGRSDDELVVLLLSRQKVSP